MKKDTNQPLEFSPRERNLLFWAIYTKQKHIQAIQKKEHAWTDEEVEKALLEYDNLWNKIKSE